VAVQLSKLVQN